MLRALRSTLFRLVLPGVIGVLGPLGAAAAPHLVADLNSEPNTEPEAVFVDFSNDGLPVLAFQGSDPAHGTELWRSDGTPEGTRRLTDACPGPCSASPRGAQMFRGRLFFTADDGVSGRELWQSDGTPGSERRVRDLCPGPCSSEPTSLTAFGDRLLFLASIEGSWELWTTNGSRRGTTKLAHLCTQDPLLYFGCGDSQIVLAAGLAFFTVDGSAGLELWRTDGTPAGTGRLRDFLGGTALPAGGVYPASLGSFVIFWSVDGLWRTDGTAAGTSRVERTSDLDPEPSGGSLYPWTVIDGVGYARLDDKLVRSDGTAEGTAVIHEYEAFSGLNGPVAVAGGAVFVENGALWRTQGSRETTREVEGLDTGYIGEIASLGDRAVFLAGEDLDLWVTDGTAAGTQLIAAHAGRAFSELKVAGGRAYWVGGSYYLATKLFATDGTGAGTGLVHDFTGLPGSSGPLSQAVLGGQMLFSAQTGPLTAPLFATDGTTTRLVSHEASWASPLTVVGGRAVFPAYDRHASSEDFRVLMAKGLWAATPLGAALVDSRVRAFRSPMPFAGDLYFGAAVGLTYFNQVDIELWRTQGGRALVSRKIDPAWISTQFHHTCIGESSAPGPGVVVGGRLLFAADDGRNGRELWQTDGTGESLLRDIDPARVPRLQAECDVRTETGLSSNPQGLVAFRNGALFTADDGATGRELWWTNGTRRGTRLVADLRPGPESPGIHGLTVFDGTAYFFTSRAPAGPGEALWRTDGTAAGTVLVDDLTIGGTPSWAGDPVAAGGQLFFSVYNEATGAELWASAGTGASTHLVADLRPGAPGSFPQQLTAVEGVLLFAADDGLHGLEPWRSDGTMAGTRRLGDIHPGLDASSPGPFSVVGDQILTGADDGVHGRELWAIPLADIR